MLAILTKFGCLVQFAANRARNSCFRALQGCRGPQGVRPPASARPGLAAAARGTVHALISRISADYGWIHNFRTCVSELYGQNYNPGWSPGVAAGRKGSTRLLQRARGLRRLLGDRARAHLPATGRFSAWIHFFRTPWTGSYLIWPMSIGIHSPFFTTGLKFTWLNFEGNGPSKTNSAARRLADLISLYNSSGPGTGTAAHRMLPVGPQFGAFAPPKQDSAALFRYPSQAGSIRFNFVF